MAIDLLTVLHGTLLILGRSVNLISFNCLLPAFQCRNYAACDEFNGKCKCPPGFGGDDCLQPGISLSTQTLIAIIVCDSLADGANRHIRPPDQQKCNCKDGWSGINCNLCETDASCGPLMPGGMNGTCYKGGLTVKENYQMCQVINRKIIDQLDPKVPEVTFSCHKADSSCGFQCTDPFFISRELIIVWVDERESFYCSLDDCAFTLGTWFPGSTLMKIPLMTLIGRHTFAKK